MISFGRDNQMKVSLIDYNLISKRPESTQKIQKKPKIVGQFQGCLDFASLEKLNFEETSPRDDLKALFHMMLVLLNG